MEKKTERLNIHQKLELVIGEMVDREIRLTDGLKEFQKIYIELTAKKYKGNKTKMAGALGIHRNTLLGRAKALKVSKK
jgi:transcriptional regulator with PAS, ATPase and Fis domain